MRPRGAAGRSGRGSSGLRWPVALALASAAGLLAALVGDGAWDWLGCALLASPVGVTLLAWVAARPLAARPVGGHSAAVASVRPAAAADALAPAPAQAGSSKSASP